MEHGGDDAGGVETGVGIHGGGRSLFDIGVRQEQGAEFQTTVEQAVRRQELCDMRTETADRAFLNGNQNGMLAGKARDQSGTARSGNGCSTH